MSPNKTPLALFLGVFVTICFVYLYSSSIPTFDFFHRASADSHAGLWGPIIPVPLVAAAAVVLPVSGKVLLWAADRDDVFGSDLSNPGRTVTALYDPATGSVTNRSVSVTHHNMFCPGLCLDSTGRPIVSGGVSESRTSFYDEVGDEWIAGPNMMAGRGYHSQTVLSDGRIFTIGGSWSGPIGGKNGEIYDPESKSWSWLPDCLVEPMLTNDKAGNFSADNHAWLFGWRNGSVFQAGPSVAMNWYGTAGSGSQVSAGSRGIDLDSMSGNAVMYDAVNGKVLTLGGSTSYSDAYGSTASHIITLAEPFTFPDVKSIRPMAYPRVFANSVVLPTGDIFNHSVWDRDPFNQYRSAANPTTPNRSGGLHANI